MAHLRNQSFQNNSREISPLDVARARQLVNKGSIEIPLPSKKTNLKIPKKKALTGTDKLLVKIKGIRDEKPITSTLKD